jgi:hypothetical protein
VIGRPPRLDNTDEMLDYLDEIHRYLGLSFIIAEPGENLQNIIAAAVAKGAATIAFLPYQYDFDEPIVCAPTSGQTHINFIGMGGSGANGVELNWTGGAETAITIKNNSRFTFDNIGIRDSGTGTLGLHLTSLAAGASTANGHFRNVRIEGFTTNLQLGTTDNKAAADLVFTNLEVSSGTTGMLIQGPSSGANYTTQLTFNHLAGVSNATGVVFDGPLDSNITVLNFIGHSIGQSTTRDFDFQAPCFATILGGYSESAGASQFIRSGSSDPTENSDTLTHITIEGTYAAYPSSPSNFVCLFNQPGHYTVKNSVLATGSIELGGYDDGGGGVYKSQLTIEQSTIVSASARVAYRAGSDAIWLVRHLGSGVTAEASNNTDDERIYMIRSDGTEYDIYRMKWSHAVIADLNNIGKYTAADTTPCVIAWGTVAITNAGAVTITAFDDGLDQQEITLVFADANTTIQDGASIQLAGGANFVSTANDTLTLKNLSGVWYEVSRSLN